MQLSPSTVPSDSNVLAGIFPVSASLSAAEGPGLAAPAGFADLMAALAPGSAAAQTADTGSVLSAPIATSVGVQSQPVALTGCGVAVADLRAPALVAQVEGEATQEIASADIDVVSTTEAGIETASSEPSKTESLDAKHTVERPRIRESRRSLHEPVASLETMVVPQVTVGPAPVAAEELDEEPAELDTEEAPLDEDGSSNEEATEEVASPSTRAEAMTSGPVFAEIEPQPEVIRSTLNSRRVAGAAQSPVSAPNAQVARPAATPFASSVTKSVPEAVEMPRVEVNAGQGPAQFFAASDSRESAVASVPSQPKPAPVADSSTVPVAARESLAQTQTATSETVAMLPQTSGSAAALQPVGGELQARATIVSQPVKATTVELREPVAVTDGDSDEQVLPTETAAAYAGVAAAASTTQREATSRAVAPRVAAAYATREKFAAERVTENAERFSTESSAKISFLSADGESVERGGGSVGIDVAKTNAVMPALSSHVNFASLTPVAVSVHDVASSAVQEPAEIRAPEAVSNAEQAVEVVLRAVDTAANREQKVVKLEFSVGDADLSVRVELANNEVRTTFRTESHELRAALAHEWQSVSTDSADQGGVRLAPAVISDKDPSPSTSADANSQRQERHAARQDEASASAQQNVARSLLRSSVSADVPPVATPVLRTFAPVGTAQRLHLFA